MRGTLTDFWWDGIYFIRLNYWDAEGRYSTKSFEDPIQARAYAAGQGVRL